MPGAKRWTPEQDARLEELMKERKEPEDGKKEEYWAWVAEQLPLINKKGRTGTAAQCRATDLKLREKIDRAKRGPAWHAQGRKQSDATAAKRPKTAADSALLSPVGAPPSEPREKRKAAALGEAARRAEPEEAKRQALPLTVEALLGENARRLQIAIYFLEECDAPAREEWKVRKGTVYERCSVRDGAHHSVVWIGRDVLSEAR